MLVLGVPHSTALETEHLQQYPGPECPCTNIKSVSSREHRERRHRRHLSHTIAQLGPRCLPGCLIASLKKHLVQWLLSAKKQIKWLQCLHLGSHLVTMFSLSFQRDLRERDQRISTNSYTLLLLQVVVQGNQHFA